jgi:hypothetical protein
MKKILLFILPLIAVAFSSCNDDDEVLNTKLIKGQWQLVSQDSSERVCIYNFTTSSENTWSWGTLTTYYLTVSGTTVHDKVYEWHVSDPNNSDPVLLDIIYQGDLDKEGFMEKMEYYEVEKLSSSEMVLKKVEEGDSRTFLRFVRRDDL